MSGTRLRSQRVQATEKTDKPALVIVAHGERGGAGDDRFVYELAEQLRRGGDYSTVRGCFVSKEPSLRSMIDGMSAESVIIYPLFMSDGYFVKQAIPQSINKSHQAKVLPPIGLNRQLPRLVAKVALQIAKATGWVPDDCHLLLVAHGSKHDRASRNATGIVAKSIEEMDEFGSVSMSFLEESPFLEEQLASISGPLLVAGLFIGQGMHGSEDLPHAINKCRRDDVVLLAPMTQWPGLVELICSELNETATLNQRTLAI